MDVSDVAIDVRGLRKAYGGVDAVAGIDLAVPAGTVFGLLGPNGAGKTTTVEILEGFRRRDAGDVRVLGSDPADGDLRMRRRIGVVLQSADLDPYLTARETVDMYGGMYPHPREIGEVLELVGLGDRAGARLRELSGGQRRRLDVAVALAGDPDVLFLDEPTTGFDPGARRSAWGMIGGLAALGKTVFLTTHYMDEAQELADRVAVIARGRIVAEGDPATLGERHLAASLIRFRLPAGRASLPSELTSAVDAADGWTEIRAADPTPILHALTGWSIREGVELGGLQVTRPSLEDVYLELTEETS